VKDFASTKKIVFSGTKQAIDYVFYLISKLISNSNKLKSTLASNKVIFDFKGCNHISLMSCHYLFSLIGKSLENPNGGSIKNIVSQNRKITENMILSMDNKIADMSRKFKYNYKNS
jgi:hypothetical protein